MIFLQLFKPLGSDFVVYFEAGKMFAQGFNPYLGLFTRIFPFNYPPPALFFLWWLSLFDYSTANIIWNILSTVSVLVSIWLVLKIARSFSWRKFLMLSFLFTIPFFPVKFNIGNGQINHFLLLFCVLGLYFYNSGRKSLSAFFLAFATGIKFAPVVFVLYFAIKKDWDQVARYAIYTLAAFLVSLAFVPWSFQSVYWFSVLPLSFTLGAKDWYYNQSLFGFLARSLSNAIAIQLSYYLLSLCILFLTWWRGRRISPLRSLAAVSTLYLILHPIALQHYFAFAIIPFLLLLDKRGWLPLSVAYVLLAVDIKNFNSVPKEFNFVLSHDFYGIFLLWLLALWREKFWVIVAGIWSSAVVLAFIFMLLCRVKFCF